MTSVMISAQFMILLRIVTLLGTVRFCFGDSHAFSAWDAHLASLQIHSNSSTSNQHAELQPMAPGEVFVNLCSQVSLSIQERRHLKSELMILREQSWAIHGRGLHFLAWRKTHSKPCSSGRRLDVFEDIPLQISCVKRHFSLAILLCVRMANGSPISPKKHNYHQLLCGNLYYVKQQVQVLHQTFWA